ncbi:MAG: DUF5946 family protein, partial [Thermomicrobiales bacterium]
VLVLERGYDFAQATDAMSTLLRTGDAFPNFEPPSFLGSITVQDVRAAANFDQHVDLVNRWGESAWAAWESHHETIHRWVDTSLAARPSRR